MIEHVRAVLAQEGIKTSVRNQYLTGGIGQLPAFDCWPELWLLDDAQTQRAQAIINTLLAESTHVALASWRCQACQEMIEGQFALCWNCGEPSPDTAA